jgi:hypothetical protein
VHHEENRMTFARRLSLAAVLAAVAACSDSSGPSNRPPAELNIVRTGSGASFAETTLSFWAHADQDAEGRLFFAAPGGGDGAEFVRLRIPKGALLAAPDGTPFGPRDSVLVTMQITDPTQLAVVFQPSGLRFDPVIPAQLEMHYDNADDDFNGDGQVNGEDTQIESTLAIWRQEQPSDPFVRLGSLLSISTKDCRSSLMGFTRYALAY